MNKFIDVFFIAILLVSTIATTGLVLSLAVKAEPNGYVTLSFDDGLRNQYLYAFPEMERRGINGVFNVISNLVGKSDNWLTVEQLIELENAGNEIASHSASHPDFTTLTEAQVRQECETSLQTLTSFGLNVQDFVYPYGKGGEHIDAVVSEYYRSGRRRWGVMTLPWTSWRVSGWTSYEDTNSEDYAVYKNIIDEVVVQHGWCILYFHGVDPTRSDGGFITTYTFSKVLSYINSVNVKIVTMNDMLNPTSEPPEMTAEDWLIFWNWLREQQTNKHWRDYLDKKLEEWKTRVA